MSNITKRKLAVAVWQKIKPLLDQYRHLYIPVSGKHELELKDSEPSSDFYFFCDRSPNADRYVIEHKPTSTQSNNLHREEVKPDDFVSYLRYWLEALDMYDKLVTIYDDPILKSYQAEFTTYFSLQDEDADTAPFDLERQLKLDEYLTNIKGLLESRKAAATEDEQKELSEISAEVDSLQKDMTSLTKNQTVSRLSKILAKGRKFGIDLVKEFLGELKKEAFKMIAKATLTGELPSIDTIMGYIH